MRRVAHDHKEILLVFIHRTSLGFRKPRTGVHSGLATEDRGAIDLVLLQETHVAVGEADTMDKLYHQTCGFVQEPGRTMWTEAAVPRGGVVILLHLYFSIRTLEP